MACGPHPAATRTRATPSTSATLSISMLRVRAAVPARATPSTIRCRGSSLCREIERPSVAPDEDEIAEANEDCVHRGGEPGTAPCPRDDVVASCVLGGGGAPIRIFTYAQEDASEQEEAISKVGDLCDALDGAFDSSPPDPT